MKKRLLALAALAVIALPAGCKKNKGEELPAFQVLFNPNPVAAQYDGRFFWWTYEVTVKSNSDEAAQVAGFYIDRGAGKWIWTNVNKPLGAGATVAIWTERLRIDPARVKPGATAKHGYRVLVSTPGGVVEVTAEVTMQF